MFEKQIDRAEAFRLANTGMRVKVLVPGPKGSEWEEARTTTLSAYLEGCLFFRDEPAGVNPDFEAAVPPPNADGAVAGASTGTEKQATKRVGTGTKRKRKSVDVGKILALHKAGWSNVKIADELGMNEKTVWYYVDKARKESQDGEK